MVMRATVQKCMGSFSFFSAKELMPLSTLHEQNHINTEEFVLVQGTGGYEKITLSY